MRRLFTLREPPPALIKRSVGALGVGLVVFVWWLATYDAVRFAGRAAEPR
jgi:hypothetical protein